MTRAEIATLACTLGGLTALLVAPIPGALVLNVSSSVPIGIYRLARRAPVVGELALVRLPAQARALAIERGYIGRASTLIKPVAATAGHVVCRAGLLVDIDGRKLATARAVDGTGRPMPEWSSCRRLDGGQIFVLSADPKSFDSRYIGVLESTAVLGTAIPVWTASLVSPAAVDDASAARRHRRARRDHAPAGP